MVRMNKQNIIDDYKQTIERLQKECTEKTDLNIELTERVKELEQKHNIIDKTIGGLKVHIKEIDKLLDKLRGAIK